MLVCNRCLFNDSMPNVFFNECGICNYCKIHDNLNSQYDISSPNIQNKINSIVNEIKLKGKGKKYDCVVGVSGGCDSSFLMYLLKEKYNLNPLAVTFDNTWNSSIATENIHKITSSLNIDLYAHVVDNDEFDDICRSFLYASVPDADIPNDIAIAKLYYMTMDEFDISYAICGHSFRTEGTVPLGWTYMDGKYVESVHKKFGKIPIKTFLNLDLDYWMKHLNTKRIRLLYYFNYNKEEIKEFLNKKFDWQWYGGHHFENEYTKFVKSYLLPQKFNIDKRCVEFSALIRSGQMKKEDVIDILSTPPEFDENLLNYVISRLGFSKEEFKNIMNLPIKTYKDYETSKNYFIENKSVFYEMMKNGSIPETFYEKYCV